MTRARTAPLALRGPALSLNHAFHLELERAQLLRVVLLTPGKNPLLGGKNQAERLVCASDAVCWSACFLVSAANVQEEQKPCGPIRNKVCCLGGVSLPPLFKGAWQRFSTQKMVLWVD